MTALPTPPLVSVEEYLNSSYRPDLEYVDGVLLERGVPTIAHGLLQRILLVYLDAFGRQFHFSTLPEVRTRIVERARYRIPDVLLCPLPLPAGKVMTAIPWVVIEILSPDDKLPVQLERFRDYKRIGVPQVILLDPENLLAYRFEEGSLLQTAFTSLDLPSGTLPFDTQSIFNQLVQELGEGRE